jgi:hypothetical protein
MDILNPSALKTPSYGATMLGSGMDRLGELLTQRLCEVKRTQGDLHDWVHAVIDASAVSAETRSRFQLREDLLAKKFMEEIWPLSNTSIECRRRAAYFTGNRARDGFSFNLEFPPYQQRGDENTNQDYH